MQQREEDDLSALYERAAAGEVLIDGYRLCGPGCSSPDPADNSCKDHQDCVDRGCHCHLFSRDEDAPPQDPDSWKHRAKPDEPHDDVRGQVFRCFCVKEA